MNSQAILPRIIGMPLPLAKEELQRANVPIVCVEHVRARERAFDTLLVLKVKEGKEGVTVFVGEFALER